MYTYEYERILCKGVFSSEPQGYQEIIACRAEEGWRYVGFIPAKQLNGFVTAIDLVFEKEC